MTITVRVFIILSLFHLDGQLAAFPPYAHLFHLDNELLSEALMSNGNDFLRPLSGGDTLGVQQDALRYQLATAKTIIGNSEIVGQGMHDSAFQLVVPARHG